MIKRIFILVAIAVMAVGSLRAQQYTGLTGLIHTPSAFTGAEGDYRISGHWLDSHTLPAFFRWDGEPYSSVQFAAGITPFEWVEIAYSFILLKNHRTDGRLGYYHKDQLFSVKLRPIPEGPWWPAVAVGGYDVFTSFSSGNRYHSNLFAAASKTVKLGGERLGITVAYRRWMDEGNSRWNGFTGGVEYTPSLLPALTAAAEWTGCDVNVGVSALLFGHIRLQASLLDWRWPSAGIAVTGNLL